MASVPELAAPPHLRLLPAVSSQGHRRAGPLDPAQTLANEERFITPISKSGRTDLPAEARACQREYELFCQLREQVGAMAAPIRQAARAVAALDALTGLADVAASGGYRTVDQRQPGVEAGGQPPSSGGTTAGNRLHPE